MIIRPITFRAACAFVRKLHRHNKPPRGHKFSVGLYDGDMLVGVAMCGRPVARGLDDGLTLEVNRTCTDGHRNANSMLYGACRRAAFAMGYVCVITYTRADECGTSLRAAGFVRVRELAPRRRWMDEDVSTNEARDAFQGEMFGVERQHGVARVLWESKKGAT